MHRLKRVHQALRASMEQALAAVGITSPQYAMLVALQNHPGATNATLARLLFVSPQATNELMQGLEASALVERVPEAGRRQIPLRLTREGERRVAQGHQAIVKVESAALAPVSRADQARFFAVLEDVAARLEAETSPPSPLALTTLPRRPSSAKRRT